MGVFGTPPRHQSVHDWYYENGRWQSEQDKSWPCCTDPDRCSQCRTKAAINRQHLCSVCSADDPCWGPTPEGYEHEFLFAVTNELSSTYSSLRYNEKRVDDLTRCLERLLAWATAPRELTVEEFAEVIGEADDSFSVKQIHTAACELNTPPPAPPPSTDPNNPFSSSSSSGTNPFFGGSWR